MIDIDKEQINNSNDINFYQRQQSQLIVEDNKQTKTILQTQIKKSVVILIFNPNRFKRRRNKKQIKKINQNNTTFNSQLLFFVRQNKMSSSISIEKQQMNRQFTHPHNNNNDKQQDKKGSSSIFTSLIHSFTRSKTPKQEQTNSNNNKHGLNNKSALMIQKQTKEDITPKQIFIKSKPIQNNSDFQYKDKQNNHSTNNNNHDLSNDITQKLRSSGIATLPQSSKVFEPYSQQTTLVQFLKREQIDHNINNNNNNNTNNNNMNNNSNHYNINNKENKMKNNQLEIMNDNDEYNSNRIQKNNTKSVRYIRNKDNGDIMDERIKKARTQNAMFDISSRDMLADQTIGLESNINRQNQNDISIKPVLNIETLESEDDWNNEDNDDNHHNGNHNHVDTSHNNIGYFTQMDDDTIQKNQIIIQNQNGNYYHTTKSNNSDGESTNNINQNNNHKTNNNNNNNNVQYQPQDKLNNKINQFQHHDLITTTTKNSKDNQDDDGDENDVCISQGSLPQQSSNSNNTNESLPQKQNIPNYNNFNNNMKQPHILNNIPLFIQNDKEISNNINQMIINDSKYESNIFEKDKQQQLQQQNEKNEEEIQLVQLQNKSLIEGVKKVYDIKIQIQQQQLQQDGKQNNIKKLSIMIDQYNFNNYQLKCQLYQEDSKDQPQLYFTDILTPLKQQQQFSSNNNINIQEQGYKNVYKLQEKYNKKYYQFTRFQNIQDCSCIFQDMILQDLQIIKLQPYYLNKKEILLYQHQNNDIYLLQEIDEYLTIQDLLNLFNQTTFQLKKLTQIQLLDLLQDILKNYLIFENDNISLPNLSSDNIIINHKSFNILFVHLSNCYPIDDFSEDQKVYLRKKEKEKIINIFKNLKKITNLNIKQDSTTSLSKIQSNTTLQIQNLELNDNNDFEIYLQNLFETIIQNNGTISALENIQNYKNQINNNNNTQSIYLEDKKLNSASIFFQNQELLQKQLQKSKTTTITTITNTTNLTKSITQTTNLQNNINLNKQENINERIIEQKKSRQYLQQYIIANEQYIRTKRIRSQQCNNFFKCQKLQILSEIYNSIFMNNESIKTLEELKNLKGECYGIDSIEYLKTLQTLCKKYYSFKMYKQLLLYIEPLTDYLRHIINSYSHANELFQMMKIKLKMARSPSILQDLSVLFEFIQSNSNEIINYNNGDIKQDKQQQQQNQLLFNSFKLYYYLARYYTLIDDTDNALQCFQKCLAEIPSSNEQNENNKNNLQQNRMIQKINFYSLTNIARIKYRQKKIEESTKILRNLEQSTFKFAYPMYYQYLGIIEFEEQNYQLSYQYLHQCYILNENQQKCNRDYLELLLHYVLVSLKLYGSSSNIFQKLCTEFKNFTGDYYNLDCLLIIGNILFDEKLYDLAQQKVQSIQGILNLLTFSERNNKTLFKEYKKKLNILNDKISKIYSNFIL